MLSVHSRSSSIIDSINKLTIGENLIESDINSRADATVADSKNDITQYGAACEEVTSEDMSNYTDTNDQSKNHSMAYPNMGPNQSPNNGTGGKTMVPVFPIMNSYIYGGNVFSGPQKHNDYHYYNGYYHPVNYYPIGFYPPPGYVLAPADLNYNYGVPMSVDPPSSFVTYYRGINSVPSQIGSNINPSNSDSDGSSGSGSGPSKSSTGSTNFGKDASFNSKAGDNDYKIPKYGSSNCSFNASTMDIYTSERRYLALQKLNVKEDDIFASLQIQEIIAPIYKDLKIRGNGIVNPQDEKIFRSRVFSQLMKNENSKWLSNLVSAYRLAKGENLDDLLKEISDRTHLLNEPLIDFEPYPIHTGNKSINYSIGSSGRPSQDRIMKLTEPDSISSKSTNPVVLPEVPNVALFVTGATHSITNDRSLLFNYVKSRDTCYAAGNRPIRVSGKGFIKLARAKKETLIPCAYTHESLSSYNLFNTIIAFNDIPGNLRISKPPVNSRFGSVSLKNGLHIPIEAHPSSDLMFISQRLFARPHLTEFEGKVDPVQKFIGHLHRQNDKSNPSLHEKLGHFDFKIPHHRLDQFFTMDKPVDTTVKHQCEACTCGKARQKDFNGEWRYKASKPFEVVHADMGGPITVPTADAKYEDSYLVVVDEFTRYVRVFVVDSKKESVIAQKILHFFSEIQNQFGYYPQILFSDGGKEFTNEMLTSELNKKGILHVTTTAYVPQLNGFIERYNLTLFNAVRTLLIEAGLPPYFWKYAILYAADRLNLVYNKNIHSTPLHFLKKHQDFKIRISELRPFGCLIYWTKTEVNHKVNVRALPGIYLYKGGNVGHFIFDIKDKKEYNTRNIIYTAETIYPSIAGYREDLIELFLGAKNLDISDLYKDINRSDVNYRLGLSENDPDDFQTIVDIKDFKLTQNIPRDYTNQNQGDSNRKERANIGVNNSSSTEQRQPSVHNPNKETDGREGLASNHGTSDIPNPSMSTQKNINSKGLDYANHFNIAPGKKKKHHTTSTSVSNGINQGLNPNREVSASNGEMVNAPLTVPNSNASVLSNTGKTQISNEHPIHHNSSIDHHSSIQNQSQSTVSNSNVSTKPQPFSNEVSKVQMNSNKASKEINKDQTNQQVHNSNNSAPDQLNKSSGTVNEHNSTSTDQMVNKESSKNDTNIKHSSENRSSSKKGPSSDNKSTFKSDKNTSNESSSIKHLMAKANKKRKANSPSPSPVNDPPNEDNKNDQVRPSIRKKKNQIQGTHGSNKTSKTTQVKDSKATKSSAPKDNKSSGEPQVNDNMDAPAGRTRNKSKIFSNDSSSKEKVIHTNSEIMNEVFDSDNNIKTSVQDILLDDPVPEDNVIINKIDHKNDDKPAVKVPSRFHQAIRLPMFVEAMKKELESIHNKEVWIEVDKPKDPFEMVPLKWVYAYKEPEGKAKARLVVRGDKQNPTTYDETYSPTVDMTTFRIVMGLIAQEGWNYTHMNISTAYLNADIDSVIYIRPPPNYPVGKGKVLKLKKALYGLKQSGKLWYEHIKSFLEGIGFKVLDDKGIFIKSNFDKFVILLVYVDDLLITGNDDTMSSQVKVEIEANYKCRTLDGNHMLGLDITRGYDSDGKINRISLTGKSHISKVVDQFLFSESKGKHSTPFNVTFNFDPDSIDDSDDPIVNEPFMALIGGLNYIALQFRPDIAYNVNYLASLIKYRRKSIWNQCQNIVLYLSKTMDEGIHFNRVEGLSYINCFCDASHANGDGCYSRSGFIFFTNGPIYWRSKVQTLITDSSTEAEIVSLFTAEEESNRIRDIFEFLSENTNLKYNGDHVNYFEDNQSAIALIRSNKSYSKRKFVRIKQCILNEELISGFLSVSYIPTKSQLADILTKQLPTSQFQNTIKWVNGNLPFKVERTMDDSFVVNQVSLIDIP